MIRDIKEEDKEQILVLAEMFFKERLEKDGAHFSKDHASLHFDQFIKVPGLLALCAQEGDEIVGMIVGIASSIIFAKELAMQELVWYVKPKNRNQGLRLLREFEKRSAQLGYNYVMMVGMTDDPVLRMYPKLGYNSLHQTFIKKAG